MSKNNVNFTQKLQGLNLGPSLKLLLYILVLVFGLAAYVTLRPSGLQIKESTLQEQEYGAVCLSNMTKSNDKLQQQKLCHELNGHHITNWSGIVKDIKILSIENKVESVANVLPTFAANGLACMYGERYPEECDDDNTLLCAMAKVSQRPCHLQKYNRYKFVVTVQCGESETFSLQLDAGHSYQAKLSKLSIGEEVIFSGILNADTRHIALTSLNSKDSLDVISMTEKEQSVLSLIDDAWKVLFRFVFSPVIIAV
uniref:Wolframin-like n=1 Tax=Phallusia mammillata TaxID=59560 RepID=A0A6F9DXQ1_9ASCI|nr:wolframin-like [Phallusia mammillata]